MLFTLQPLAARSQVPERRCGTLPVTGVNKTDLASHNYNNVMQVLYCSRGITNYDLSVAYTRNTKSSTAIENQKKVMAAIEKLKLMLDQQTKASIQIKGSCIEVMKLFHFGFCIENYLNSFA